MISAIDYSFLVFSCISKSQSYVLKGAKRVLEQFGTLDRYAIEMRAFDLSRVYLDVPPSGGAHPHRFVLFEPTTTRETTVFVVNYQDGGSSFVLCLSKELDCECWQFSLSKDAKEYPKNSFSVFKSGEYKRHVHSMLDSNGWSFNEVGEPFDVEDVQQYKNRLIKHRLTRQSVIALARNCGWNIESAEFWLSKRDAAYFIEQNVG